MSRSLTRPGAVYVGAGLVLGAFVWVAAWLAVDHEREELLAAGTERASRLAVFFEGSSLAALRYGDGYARMMRREYRAGGVPAARAAMEEVSLDTTMVSHITVIDQHGTPVFNSGYPIKPGTSAADRDYFVFQRDRTDDQLFVSLPHRGRNSGRLVMRLVRRIVLDDGSFGGVVFAGLDAENVVAFFRAVSPGPHSSASLVGTDKRIRARSSWGRLGPGQDISESRIWHELAAGPVGGYLQTSVVDGVTRYYAYRRLSEYPLVVAIGVALADIGEDAAAY